MVSKSVVEDPARARVIREERILRVLDIMVDGHWRETKSARALAIEWGVTLDTVQAYAREAMRIVQHAMGSDREEMRQRILMGVETVTNTALDRKRFVSLGDGGGEYVSDPDCKTALAAYEFKAKMLGLTDTTPQGNLPPQFKSAREMLAYTERMLPLLKAQAAREAIDEGQPVAVEANQLGGKLSD